MIATQRPWYIPESWVTSNGRPTSYLRALIDDGGLEATFCTLALPNVPAKYRYEFSEGDIALVWTYSRNSDVDGHIFKFNARTGELLAQAKRPASVTGRGYSLARSSATWVEFEKNDRSWRVYQTPDVPLFEGVVEDSTADTPVISDDGSLIAFFGLDNGVSILDAKTQAVVSHTGPLPHHWFYGEFSRCNRYFLFHGTDRALQRLMLFAVQTSSGKLKNRGYQGVDLGYRGAVTFFSEPGDPHIYFVSDGGHCFYFDTDAKEFSGMYAPRLDEFERPLAWHLKDGVLYSVAENWVAAHSPSGSLLRTAPRPTESGRVKWSAPQQRTESRRQNWKRWLR